MPAADPRPGGDPFWASPLQRLTLREREVADYLTAGRSSKAIAAELGLSYRTVEAHRARIFYKVGVRNAVELTQRYVRWRLKVMPADEAGTSTVVGSIRRGRPSLALCRRVGTGRQAGSCTCLVCRTRLGRSG